MSLLESPIAVLADKGDGPEPMLLIGTETMGKTARGGEGRETIVYLCIDAEGGIFELTREWISVNWRHNGRGWVILDSMGNEVEYELATE